MSGQPPSTSFEEVAIRPVTQRPCLLIDAADLPAVRRRYEAMPGHLEPGDRHLDTALHALLYGDEADRRKATRDFMADVRRVFGGPGKDALWKERRANELLYKFDLIASFGLLSKAEQAEFEADAVAFASFEIGADPAAFPSPRTPSTNGLEFPEGFSTCNRWPDRFLGAALVGLNFPDQPLAQAWVRYACQQIQFMLEQGNWDGAWNEVPRYHNWTILLFSTLFEALRRRTGVDFYQDPNTKALLDWYVRFSSPLVRFPETTKVNPAGEPTLPVWGDSNYGNAFQACALFAPHYATTDPAFARRLMWMWRRAGSPFQHGWNFDLYFPLLVDPGLPDEAQILGSAFCRRFGLVALRSAFDTPDETVVFMRGGSQGITHKRADLGSIDLFSHGLPLALGSQSGPYRDPEIAWNRSQQSNNGVVFGGRSRDRGDSHGTLLAFCSTPQADYVAADCSRPASRTVKPEESFTWRRHLLLVKQPDYLVVWDEIASPMAAEWFLHTTAERLEWSGHRVVSHTAYGVDLDVEVLSPAAPLVPNEREGPFGSWLYDSRKGKEDPYPFMKLKYVTIPARPGESFVTVLHPRKSAAPALTATLVSSGQGGIALRIQCGDKTDVIALGKDGASLQREGSPPLALPLQLEGNTEPGARFLSNR